MNLGLSGKEVITATYFSAARSLKMPFVDNQDSDVIENLGFLAGLDDRSEKVARACSLPFIRFLARS